MIKQNMTRCNIAFKCQGLWQGRGERSEWVIVTTIYLPDKGRDGYGRNDSDGRS